MKTRTKTIEIEITPRKKQVKSDPVRIRERRLKNGDRSLFLDIYRDGQRDYEFLNLYITGDRHADKRTMMFRSANQSAAHS